MSSVRRGLVVMFLLILPMVLAAVVINNRDVYINGGNLFIDNNAVLTVATPFSGDVTGTYNNLQLGENVVGAYELNEAQSYTVAGLVISGLQNCYLYANGSGVVECNNPSSTSTSIACSDCAPYFVDVTGDQMTGPLEINLLSQTENNASTDWNELVDALVIRPNGDHVGITAYSPKFVFWNLISGVHASIESNDLYVISQSPLIFIKRLNNDNNSDIVFQNQGDYYVARIYLSAGQYGGIGIATGFKLDYTSLPTRFFITNGGDVGIGTVSPSHRLHVEGNVYSSNYLIGASGLCIGTDCRTSWPSGISDVNGEPPVVVTGTDVKTVSISIGPSLKVENNALEINVNRSVGCTGTNAIQEINLVTGNVVCIDTSTGTTGAITGSGDVNYLAYFTNTDSIASASTLYYNPSTGYLGIGTTSPTYLLDVNGPLNVRTSIRVDLPTTDNPSTEANDVVDVFYARTSFDHIGITGNVDKFVFWNKDVERFAGIEVNFVRAHGPVYSENNLVLTVATPFSGDVTGTYDNLQLGENVVGAYELNLDEINDVYINVGDSAGGDLSGTYPNPTLAKIQGYALPEVKTVLTPGALYWNVGSWSIQPVDTNASDDLTVSTTFSGDVSGTYDNLQLNAGVVGTTELADNSVTSAKIVDGTIQVADLNTDDFNTLYDARYVKKTDSASGDIEGNFSSGFVVTGIRNKPVSTAEPELGQALMWDGTAWTSRTLVKTYVITDGSTFDGKTIYSPGDCLLYAYLVGGGGNGGDGASSSVGGGYNGGGGGGSGAVVYILLNLIGTDSLIVSVGGAAGDTTLSVNGAQVALAGAGGSGGNATSTSYGAGGSGGVPEINYDSSKLLLVLAEVNGLSGQPGGSNAGGDGADAVSISGQLVGTGGEGGYYNDATNEITDPVPGKTYGAGGGGSVSLGGSGKPGIAILTFVCN